MILMKKVDIFYQGVKVFVGGKWYSLGCIFYELIIFGNVSDEMFIFRF